MSDATVGHRLRAARELVGLKELSARELDRLAGLHQGHVWAIETGHRPSIESDTAIALARVLGVTLDWLLTGQGDEPIADDVIASVERARAAHREQHAATASHGGA